MDYKLIGRNIRNARRLAGLTQENLAEQVELSVNHISHVEIGTSPISLPALIKICNALNITSDYLLYDNLPTTTGHISADVVRCFKDASPKEVCIMLSVAQAAKQTMRQFSD